MSLRSQLGIGANPARGWRVRAIAVGLAIASLTIGCGSGTTTSAPSGTLGPQAAASIHFGGRDSELCFSVAVEPVIAGAKVSITATPTTGLVGSTTVTTVTDIQGGAVASWHIVAGTSADWTVEATITTPSGVLVAKATAGTTSSGDATLPDSPPCANG